MHACVRTAVASDHPYWTVRCPLPNLYMIAVWRRRCSDPAGSNHLGESLDLEAFGGDSNLLALHLDGSLDLFELT